MTVYDFCNLVTDDSAMVAIYDMTLGEECFCGEMRDALYSDFADCEVMSFDIDSWDGAKRGVYVILNIETGEEDF